MSNKTALENNSCNSGPTFLTYLFIDFNFGSNEKEIS